MKTEKEIKAKRTELRKKRIQYFKDADKASKQKTKSGRMLAEFNQDLGIQTTRQIDIINWVLK
jgi:hypothetical protein